MNSVLYKHNAILSAPKFVNELRLGGRIPFVRTGLPDQSSCPRRENSTINQDYPAISVYFKMACTAVMVLSKVSKKDIYFIFKKIGPTGQF